MPSSCREILKDEETKARLAMRLANCFLKVSGRDGIHCPDSVPMSKCTTGLSDHPHSIFLDFFIAAAFMCHHLQYVLPSPRIFFQCYQFLSLGPQSVIDWLQFRSVFFLFWLNFARFLFQRLIARCPCGACVNCSGVSLTSVLTSVTAYINSYRSFKVHDNNGKMSVLVLLH